MTCGSNSAQPHTVVSIADLRAGDFGDAQSLALSGFYKGSTMGGGELTAVSAGTDDSCLIYANKAGHRFKRSLSGQQPIDIAMCGV